MCTILNGVQPVHLAVLGLAPRLRDRYASLLGGRDCFDPIATAPPRGAKMDYSK
jgi:hypothetical protein